MTDTVDVDYIAKPKSTNGSTRNSTSNRRPQIG